MAVTLRRPFPSRSDALQQLFVQQLKALPDHHSRPVRENFLSACFAGGINASPSLAHRVVRRLVGSDSWQRSRMSTASVVAASQVSFRSAGASRDDCFLDLVLELNATHRIGVEVKLEAPEGIGADGRRQLDRYVALEELDAVAFITADAEVVDDDFWNANAGRRYLAPRIRRHFVWGDFYDDVSRVAQAAHASAVVVALKGLMDEMGLYPVHPVVGELGGRLAFKKAPPRVQQNRLNMQRAMRDAVPLLDERGWSTTEKGPRDNGTLYAWRGDRALPGLRRIWAYTNLTPGSFRVWVSAEDRTTAARLFEELPAALREALEREFKYDIRPHVLPAYEGTYPAVDCRLPLRRVLGSVRKAESMGPRLARALAAAADATTEVLGARVRVAPGVKRRSGSLPSTR